MTSNHGRLIVQAVEAKNLAKKDLLTKSDPYCVFGIGAKQSVKLTNTEKTSTIRDNENPVWHQTFSFNVSNSESEVLHVKVYDHNHIHSDREIGELSIPLSDLHNGTPKDGWHDLPNKAGSVHLILKAEGFGLGENPGPQRKRIPIPPGMVFQQGGSILGIPPQRVPMGVLNATTPSTVTPENLSQTLKQMGFTCDQTSPAKLKPLIDKVIAELPSSGAASSFLIDATVETPHGPVPSFLLAKRQGKHTLAAPPAREQVADSEWSAPVNSVGAGYAANLALINANFNKLANFYPGFQGVKAQPWERKGSYSTADTIEQIYLNVATNLSAQVVTGIDKPTILAVLSTAIPPSSDPISKNYDEKDNRLVYLVLDYDPDMQDCAGIGFVYLEYRLQIQDHLNKINKKIKHQTTLTINAQSIIYSDVSELNAQVAFLEHNSAKSTLAIRGIPPAYTFKVFNSLPLAPSEEVFGSALPLESKGDKLTSLVFYAADLMCLGSLDNKASKATSTYSISTKSGFTFEMSEKIGVETKAEAGVIFAKASVTFSLDLTLSQEWETETEEEIKFKVPEGASAFVYKGYVMTRYIYFDPKAFTYTYGTAGKFYTNALFTSEIPVTGDPVYKK